MEENSVIILGAGISGLASAWYLKKAFPHFQVTILEKAERVGGWIQTDHTTGFHFEKGPRVFSSARTPKLLSLIEEVGLEDHIILSSAKKRYLHFGNKLCSFPPSFGEFVTTPVLWSLLRALLAEYKRPTCAGDESVFAFAHRRFNHHVAQFLFDPLVVGIFGGDSRKISIRAAFPQLKALEEAHGSLSKGLLYLWKTKGKKRSFTYSLKEGVGSLTQTLYHKMAGDVDLNTEVSGLSYEKGLWSVKTSEGKNYRAKYLISALAYPAMRALFSPLFPVPEVPHSSLTVVNLGYRASVLSLSGFGYLIPSCLKASHLGVVFDSSLFPQHNFRDEETRLTVLLKGDTNAALKEMDQTLKISHEPDVISVTEAPLAIPQYEVGHVERMADFEKGFYNQFPNCYFVGNYLSGVSLEHCVERAQAAICIVDGALV